MIHLLSSSFLVNIFLIWPKRLTRFRHILLVPLINILLLRMVAYTLSGRFKKFFFIQKSAIKYVVIFNSAQCTALQLYCPEQYNQVDIQVSYNHFRQEPIQLRHRNHFSLTTKAYPVACDLYLRYFIFNAFTLTILVWSMSTIQ